MPLSLSLLKGPVQGHRWHIQAGRRVYCGSGAVCRHGWRAYLGAMIGFCSKQLGVCGVKNVAQRFLSVVFFSKFFLIFN